MLTLFYFQGQDASFEIFADTYKEAEGELKRIFPDIIKTVHRLKFATQNHSCPKCSCQATECNAN